MLSNHEDVEQPVVENIRIRRHPGNEVFRYCECTKNQAAAVNLKAYDGCLEFMPAGDPGTMEALSCAACSCHRNFHRKELVRNYPVVMKAPPQARPTDPSFSGASGSSQRRVRTKFSQDQKDKMLAFAQGLGWRVKKEHEGSVQKFCEEIGINMRVLKVWIRNNKHTLGKMP